MDNYQEILETIKQNLERPDTSGEKSNFELLKEAIDIYSDKKADIVKKFVQDDKFLIVIWESDGKYYVSNINKYFIEFDKYRFNDKNAAKFLFKDLMAFSEELIEIGK